MRVVQNGFANNFGLVGKSLRKYLSTTALTATGLMALATPALADNWTDHTATEGSISIDTTVPNTTNITQYTNMVKVQGDGDINAGWTVNLAQPSSGSKYILYDTEADPTKIMGALNANGQVFIFDKNGVIFGKDSQVNVGSIIASTGTISDANLAADKLVFENVGGPDAGAIVNEGTITVAESGLAAFVAPTVVNSGVINAHAATVVLAAGEKVAIDLYGDNLVSITADGALEEALVENKGAINAAGGKVALSAQAAKGAVDNVINMDGVIDVSSVSTQGGKIILGGGNKGTVKVAGTLKAGKAGDVKVTGQNVNITETAKITNGANSNTYVYGSAGTVFSGLLTTGENSVAEVSGQELDLGGRFDLGEYTHLTFDPAILNVDAVAAAALVSALNANGVTVDVTAADRINVNADIDSSAQATNSVLRFKDENANNVLRVDLNAKIKLGASQSLIGDASTVNVSSAGLIQNAVDVTKSGINANINVAAGTYNENVHVGKSNIQFNGSNSTTAGYAIRNPETKVVGTTAAFTVTGNNVTIGGFELTGGNNGVFVNGGDNVAVANNYIHDVNANGIYYANDANSGYAFQNYVKNTGSAGHGIAFENSSDNGRAQKNKTEHTGYNGIYSVDGTGMNFQENTILDAGYTGGVDTHGISIENGSGTIADNSVDGADHGILLYQATAPSSILRNTVTNTSLEGILVESSANAIVNNNVVNKTGKDGIALYNSVKGTVNGNHIGYKQTSPGVFASAGTNNIFGDGILLVNSDGDATKSAKIQGNFITETHNTANEKGSGIQLIDSSYVLVGSDGNGSGDAAEANTISNAFWDGVRIDDAPPGSTNTVIRGNIIDNIEQVGIYVSRATNLLIDKNTISNTGSKVHLHHPGVPYGAITADFGSDIRVTNNIIHDIIGHGVKMYKVGGLNNRIDRNTINDVTNDGIFIEQLGRAVMESNKITDVGGNGIHSLKSNKVMIGGIGFQYGNNILRTGLNGIKIDGGDINYAENNKIDDAGVSGIYAVNSTNMRAIGNIIRNITDGAGVLVLGGSDAEATSNWIYNSFQGVYFRLVEGTKNFIHKNRIQEIADTAVTVEEGSTIDISQNKISGVGEDGIFVYDTDLVSVDQNDIWDIARDSIHVEFSGPTSITANKTNGSGDDGIEVLGYYSGPVLISGNTVLNSGDGNSDYYGGDGIHVRGIFGYPYNDEGEVILNLAGTVGDPDSYDGYTPFGDMDYDYSVIAYNNTVTDSGDDGIEIVGGADDKKVALDFPYEGTGRVLVYRNSVTSSGTDYYSADDGYGGDGIHVRGIYSGYATPLPALAGKALPEEDGYLAQPDGYGYSVEILGNDVDTSGGDGIEVLDGGKTLIASNDVFNSGFQTPFHAPSWFPNGLDSDGIHVENVYDNNLVYLTKSLGPIYNGGNSVEIIGNTVDTSADDGIEVVDSGKTLVASNDVSYSGYIVLPPVDGEEEVPTDETPSRISLLALEDDINRGYLHGDHDGIHVEDVYDGYEYAVSVIDNDISYSIDDGIEVEDAGRTLVYVNRVDNSGITDSGEPVGYSNLYNGADGITVHDIDAESYSAGTSGDDEFSGYAIDIIDNTVDKSVDDGIEVFNASSVYIAGNGVTNSGFISTDDNPDDEIDERFATGDDIWGADGIHVRNVWNDTDEEEYEYKVELAGEGEGDSFKPYSVVIRDNTVDTSNDDGIQVAFSGDTLIGGDTPDGDGGFVGANTVSNSGTDIGSRQFGGDGINVVTGNTYENIWDLLFFKYSDSITPVSVEVLGNNVTNSLDDGIEVVGANTVDVGYNDVTNSGDDGINVLGFAGFYTEEEPPIEQGFAKIAEIFWPYFSANVHDNNVTTSGGDGIESRGFDYLNVARNVVTGSTANGLYVSGFNNGYTLVDGNTFAGFDIGGHFESGIVDLVNGGSNSFTNGRVGLRFAPFAFGDGEEEIELFATLPNTIYDQLFPYPFSVPTSGFAPLSLVDDDLGPNSPSWPVEPPSNFGGSIGAQIFENISQFYVELANEAFFAPGTPTWLNGLNSSYDGLIPGLTGGLLSEADFNNLEAKFFHHPDGLVADPLQNLGRFWFGFFIPDLADIDQKDLFNRFDPFNGDLTGLNVRITGLPSTGFGPPPAPQNFAAGLNNIQTFAGGSTNPADLNNIQTAAGGTTNSGTTATTAADLNELDTQAGGESTNCWSDAASAAAGGTSVNVIYGGSIDDNLNQAASCGTSF